MVAWLYVAAKRRSPLRQLRDKHPAARSTDDKRSKWCRQEDTRRTGGELGSAIHRLLIPASPHAAE